MFIFLGAVNNATQSSVEFTTKQRAMSESVLSKESVQPCSNHPVQFPVSSSANSFSDGADEELSAWLARRRRWESLPSRLTPVKDEVSSIINLYKQISLSLSLPLSYPSLPPFPLVFSLPYSLPLYLSHSHLLYQKVQSLT